MFAIFVCYIVCSRLTVNKNYCIVLRRFGSAGNVVGCINKVNQRRAQLVLELVTVCRPVNHLGM